MPDTDTDMVVAVLDHLADHFHDLDDTEEAPFGEFARVIEYSLASGYMVVWHETEDRGVRIKVEPWTP